MTGWRILLPLTVTAAGLVGVLPAQVPAGGGQGERYGCIVCHADKRRSFQAGVHADRGIRCHDCHGGSPSAFERPAAHRGRFLGRPSKLQVVELCSACHADPDQMRQYGLPADQLAELRTSRHGQLLLGSGNTDAPTCTDCHDAHTIRRPEDARSNVYPTNIPITCGRCHEDAALMGKYGLSTEVLHRYRESAHGKALFDEENFAAPTCVGCHGSHASLPPGVTEVVNVCRRCHVLLGQEFARGPHGAVADAARLPGCLACHSNHGTEPVPPEEIARLCEACHEAGTGAAQVGVEIQEQVSAALHDLETAADAIRDLERMGRNVSDERFRYQAAVSDYLQIARVQHSLDLELLDELARRVETNAAIIRGTEEVRAEERWEHKLLLMPVWFLTLVTLALVWLKLHELRSREG